MVILCFQIRENWKLSFWRSGTDERNNRKLGDILYMTSFTSSNKQDPVQSSDGAMAAEQTDVVQKKREYLQKTSLSWVSLRTPGRRIVRTDQKHSRLFGSSEFPREKHESVKAEVSRCVASTPNQTLEGLQAQQTWENVPLWNTCIGHRLSITEMIWQ